MRRGNPFLRLEQARRTRREREQERRLRGVQRRFRALVGQPSRNRLLTMGFAAFICTVGIGLWWPLIGREAGRLLATPPQLLPADIQVIDGDTIRAGAERIRIANIDTPEMPPRARCTAEAILAGRATSNLRAIIEGAYEIAFIRNRFRERDVYGPLLGRIEADGVDAGAAQLKAGLAKRWMGSRTT